MDVDQCFADVLELRQRGAATVEPAARAPGGVDHTPDQQFGVAGFNEGVVGQLAGQFGQGLQVERGRQFGTFFAVADQRAVAAAAEQQPECVEDDGFAGPGFAGEDGEAGAKIEFERVDDDKVADREREQHGGQSGRVRSAVGYSRRSPQWSFWRSMSK